MKLIKVNATDGFLGDLLDGMKTLVFIDDTKRHLTHLSEYELSVFEGNIKKVKANLTKIESMIKKQKTNNQ